jgi:nucleoside-diphosphate kinase
MSKTPIAKTHQKYERTLVVIKPDGVQRTLIGEIIGRYERAGLKLVGMKMMQLSKDFVEKHYTLEPGWIEKAGQKSIKNYTDKGIEPPSKDPREIGLKVLHRLAQYLTCGPVVAMVWQGAHAVAVVRKLTGTTEPLTSDVGTIRGDFVLDSYAMTDTDGRAIRNLVHASGAVSEAEQEIALWFAGEDLHNYRLVQEVILYDVNLDGIKE